MPAHCVEWTCQPSDFNQAQWLLDHTAPLNERGANCEVGGYDVDVERQNAFGLQGRIATLAGRVDIIAHRDDDAVIVDAETVHESPSHAVPLALQRYRNTELNGQVPYREHTVSIPADAVDDQCVTNLGALIRGLSADEPARQVPGFAECRFCDISAADCSVRVDDTSVAEVGKTADF